MTAIDIKGTVARLVPVIVPAAYADGDQVGTVVELPYVFDGSTQTAKIISLVVSDKAKQSKAFNVLFFNELPTVASADNAAMDISDAEMAAKFVGHLAVASADFIALANCSYATKANLNLVVKAGATKSLWAIVQNKADPTYTSASDLTIMIGVEQH